MYRCLMPRKGYRSNTIKEELYNKVEERAEKLGISVSRYVTETLERALAQEVPATDG